MLYPIYEWKIFWAIFMKTNSEQTDDDKTKLLKITADLFLQNTVKRLKIAIKKHPAGFTFNIINLQLKTNFSSEVYLVGQHEHVQCFKTNPKSDELYKWLYANFSAIGKQGGFIGGWWDKEDIFFLDVVATIPGCENAMLAGRLNGEKEIYHPYSNRSLKVNTSQIDIHLLGDS